MNSVKFIGMDVHLATLSLRLVGQVQTSKGRFRSQVFADRMCRTVRSLSQEQALEFGLQLR